MKIRLIVPLLLSLSLGLETFASAGSFDGEVYCQSSFKSKFFFILLPDGHLRAGLPKGGLEAFDFAKDRAENPKITGTYVRSGDQLTMTYGDGRTTTWTHKRMPNGDESMQGYMWVKEYPFAAGQKLDGTYEGGGSVGVGTSTSVIASSAFTFRPDGTVAGGTSAVFTATNSSGGGSSQQIGTYSIDGYTLTVKNHDGSTTRHTICAHFKPDDPAKPATIVLDGRVMSRK